MLKAEVQKKTNLCKSRGAELHKFCTSIFSITFYVHCFVLFLFQESLDVMSTNDDNTLGFTLELYSRYMEAAKVC